MPSLMTLSAHATADGFLLLGHVHDTATALADFLEQFVATNAVPGLFGECLGHRLGWRWSRFDGHFRIESGASLLVCLQQGLDALEQYGVTCASVLQVSSAFLPRRQRQRGDVDLLFARWLIGH